jgi:hypothetical protein
MKSHRIRIALAALGAFVFALTLVSPASAFIRLTRQGNTGIVQAHWLESSLPLLSVINPTNADIPSATALSVVQASAETWENINTSFFTVNPVEYTGAPGQVTPALDANDGQNSMIFDTAGVNFAPGGTVIAFVRSTIDLADGHTLDADMVFNDRDFFCSTSSPNLTPAPPGQSSVDLQSVVTHEYGHYFGLDHTSIANATMIPFIIGDTRQRTLELDDMAGNSTIYPESASRPGGLSPGAADFAATTGTISGTVVSGFDGSAVFGAHVEALVAGTPGPLQDPLNSISAISGELTVRDGQGEYTIHGLPPGSYDVRIVPLDGIHTIAADPNIGGIFNGIDINFEVEYWNGASEGGNGFTDHAFESTPVNVSSGSDAGGVNFITNTFPGQVDVAQYGQFENIVTFRNTGFLAKRFDLPFTPPYTITKVTFPSFTFNAQLGLPPLDATFPSVRLCELNTATGLPNLAAPLFQIAPFVGSPNGANEIPVGVTINDPDKVLFWAIQFPAQPPSFPANFPFLRMDFLDMERGLFANDYSISTAGTGGTLIDRNIAVSMTAQLGSPDLSPIVPVANLGTNQRATKYEFTYSNPADKRLDGFPMAPGSTDHVNLVRRLASGLLETDGSAGTSEHISMRTDTIPAFPSGTQLWFVQAVDDAGHKTLTSNTTITGLNPDADEPNGRANAMEAKLLTLPTVNRPETYSPAGDQDYFLFNAKPGDVIQASAVSTGLDGRNDQDLVMFLFDQNGDLVAFDDDSNGGLNPKISFTAPPGPGKSKTARKFFLEVTDIQGSLFIPTGVPRVRVPQTYNLSANVIAAPALAGRIGGLVGEDGFAFANSGPNPANPQAKLLYVLPRSGGASYGVKLRIYDVNGRLVRKLVDGDQPAGPHVAVWNGTDDSGRGVASGHYYARIDAGGFSQKVGITILK